MVFTQTSSFSVFVLVLIRFGSEARLESSVLVSESGERRGQRDSRSPQCLAYFHFYKVISRVTVLSKNITVHLTQTVNCLYLKNK